MRHFTLAALVLFAPVALADDPPKTKAEYDALAKPINEKLKQAKADWQTANTKLSQLTMVKGSGGYLDKYLQAKWQLATEEKKLAGYKADEANKKKEIAATERLIAEAKKTLDYNQGVLKKEYPDVLKEGLKAAEDKQAAQEKTDEANAELKKLGPAPKK